MVKSANMNGLLDSDSDSLSSCQHRVKARLHEILQKDRDFIEEDFDRVTGSVSNMHETSKKEMNVDTTVRSKHVCAAGASVSN